MNFKSNKVGQKRGVTLIELLVVIFVIGVFIAYFFPTVISRATTYARITATKNELEELRKAIVGDPQVISSGDYVARGFKNDMGRLPRHLVELVTRHPELPPYDQYSYPEKETLPVWNPFTQSGWNGPYIRDDGNQGFLYDAWGEPYRFVINNEGDTVGLKSPGPDGEWYAPGLRNDDIIIYF
ncbi:MAG: prepilin-type N-terminal cleavage/methylation domain-containing protein [candidate division WOR-3 bacterium]|nr:prepilin-type N-terminal cleavage/methylation domain-containing protein [candidate division WOR-3 bacterium]MCX7757641.1 prepilin-type N-terminal cleavage/methylation domain-containing protein [candidate division WOR-3 bacterium]MDW7987451.1 prepilin-type N-terminal cleavage/methylation domain-containing protein [candidate division WOR-3 bacterium]